jgi:hypothetical protein
VVLGVWPPCLSVTRGLSASACAPYQLESWIFDPDGSILSGCSPNWGTAVRELQRLTKSLHRSIERTKRIQARQKEGSPALPFLFQLLTFRSLEETSQTSLMFGVFRVQGFSVQVRIPMAYPKTGNGRSQITNSRMLNPSIPQSLGTSIIPSAYCLLPTANSFCSSGTLVQYTVVLLTRRGPPGQTRKCCWWGLWRWPRLPLRQKHQQQEMPQRRWFLLFHQL